jgi:hypothetical protein
MHACVQVYSCVHAACCGSVLWHHLIESQAQLLDNKALELLPACITRLPGLWVDKCGSQGHTAGEGQLGAGRSGKQAKHPADVPVRKNVHMFTLMAASDRRGSNRGLSMPTCRAPASCFSEVWASLTLPALSCWRPA